VRIFDDADGEYLTLGVGTTLTKSWVLTFPWDDADGVGYAMVGDGDGNLSWLDLPGTYAALSGNITQFDDTVTSAELLLEIEDETGSSGTPLAVFNQNPILDDVSIGVAGVKLADDGDGAITFSSLGGGSGEAHSLTFNLDDTSNVIVVTSATATQIDFPDASIETADLIDEVRSMVWNAGAMSTDGTECEAPTEIVLNSGPKQFAIVCPMDSADTDGYIYGSTVLPDGFETDGDLRFLMTSIMITDTGDGTFHGSLGLQCVADRGGVDNASWGTESDLDVFNVSGDVQWDLVTTDLNGSDAAIAATGCAGGETLWWRWAACDSGTPENSNCQVSTTTVIDDVAILSLRMEYPTTIGD
jgi:hypothetical protein